MENGTAPGAPIRHSATASGFVRLRWWYIAVPLMVIGVVNGIDRTAIGVMLANKQFLQDLGLVGRPAFAGLLMSGFMLSYGFSPFIWGYVMKWTGPRALAIVGLLMWTATMLVSGFAQSAGALIAARIVLGIGEGFTFPVFNVLTVNWFPPKERARASSVWLNGLNLGPAVAGALIVALIVTWNWRAAFYGLAAISFLIPLPLLIFLVRDRPRQHYHISAEEVRFIEEANLTQSTQVRQIAEKPFLSNYRFWFMAVVWGCQNIYFTGWATWMPTYYKTVHHFSFKSTGYLYSLTYIFTVAAVLGAGYFSDRFMRRATFAAAGSFLAAAAMFIGGSLIASPYPAVIVLIIALCSQQMCFLMVHPILQAMVPVGSLSKAVGTTAILAYSMGTVSPYLIGYLLQVSGFGAVIAFLTLAMVASGILTSVLAKQGY